MIQASYGKFDRSKVIEFDLLPTANHGEERRYIAYSVIQSCKASSCLSRPLGSRRDAWAKNEISFYIVYSQTNEISNPLSYNLVEYKILYKY